MKTYILTASLILSIANIASARTSMRTLCKSAELYNSAYFNDSVVLPEGTKYLKLRKDGYEVRIRAFTPQMVEGWVHHSGLACTAE